MHTGTEKSADAPKLYEHPLHGACAKAKSVALLFNDSHQRRLPEHQRRTQWTSKYEKGGIHLMCETGGTANTVCCLSYGDDFFTDGTMKGDYWNAEEAQDPIITVYGLKTAQREDPVPLVNVQDSDPPSAVSAVSGPSDPPSAASGPSAVSECTEAVEEADPDDESFTDCDSDSAMEDEADPEADDIDWEAECADMFPVPAEAEAEADSMYGIFFPIHPRQRLGDHP